MPCSFRLRANPAAPPWFDHSQEPASRRFHAAGRPVID
jgi:hypothetical protein